MLLQNSAKFQAEYQEFKEAIEKITDTRVKNEAQRLLKDLLTEVKRLDQNHQGLSFQQKLPDDISLSRNKLLDIRKRLAKLLN